MSIILMLFYIVGIIILFYGLKKEAANGGVFKVSFLGAIIPIITSFTPLLANGEKGIIIKFILMIILELIAALYWLFGIVYNDNIKNAKAKIIATGLTFIQMYSVAIVPTVTNGIIVKLLWTVAIYIIVITSILAIFAKTKFEDMEMSEKIWTLAVTVVALLITFVSVLWPTLYNYL